MDLILHIGSEKTGTTSLQGWLDDNSDMLVEHGVFYSRVLGRPNNRRLSFYGLEPGTADDGLAAEGVRSVAEHEALAAKIAAQFQSEVQEAVQTGCRTFVISNEHLQSRLVTQAAVDRVARLTANRFDSIMVYCFLRPQLDTCLSLASTMARVGLEVSRGKIEQALRGTPHYYDFNAMLRRWGSAFGMDRVRPVPFRRNPDVLAYFRSVLQLDTSGFKFDKAANEGLDFRAIAIANAIRPRTAAEAAGFSPQNLFFINDLPMRDRLTLDRATGQEWQAMFEADNAALCKTWPAMRPEDLTPDWSRYPEQGNIDQLLDAEILRPQLLYVIERFHAELAFEQARRFRADSEREEALGRAVASINLCERAIEAANRAKAVATIAPAVERFLEAVEKRLDRLQRQNARARSG